MELQVHSNLIVKNMYVCAFWTLPLKNSFLPILHMSAYLSPSKSCSNTTFSETATLTPLFEKSLPFHSQSNFHPVRFLRDIHKQQYVIILLVFIFSIRTKTQLKVGFLYIISPLIH